MTAETAAIILARLDYQDRQFADHRRETLETLHEIHVQAKETNGRVKALELWKAKLDGASLMVGKVGPLVTGAFGAVIGAVATKLLS